MIFRPVSPASPCGPPMTNRPVGLMCMIVFSSRSSAGITGSITFRVIVSTISFWCTSGWCCELTTTVWEVAKDDRDVTWGFEVTNQHGDSVAQYDVLTMVATDEHWATVSG